MAKRIIVGVLLAMTALLVAACEVEEETEGPEPTTEATATPARGSPTAAAPATSEPTATPTPQPGVCPAPVRPTADELGPPPAETWGRRIQGGVAYSAGYVTVRLPAGREFVVLSYWSHDDSTLRINIYDVGTQSGLDIAGDGCERGRFLRQPSADALFDEIVGSMEIGATYACPVPVRTTPEDLPVPEQPAPEGGSGAGHRVQGGGPYELGPITLHLPAGREFLVGGGVSDPGGEFFTVTDEETRSGVFLRPDGCETSRLVRDPAADAILDEIVATLEVSSR